MARTFTMQTEKPLRMDEQTMLQLQDISIAPYLKISTALIQKERRSGGNMFRHQMDTFAILLDYGYVDSILLKASLIHDVVEDIDGFDQEMIKNADEEGEEVLKLVLEVTKKPGQDKNEYLRSVIDHGSQNARILKCADRISNMIALGYVTDSKFIERYCDETECFIFPIALEVDFNMYLELIALVMTRRQYLCDSGYFDRKKKEQEEAAKANQ